MSSVPSKRVFISSTTSDLFGYRKEARAVLAELNDEFKGSFLLIESSMDSEGLSGERETPADISRAWVRQSDWVVLIVAWNYGYHPPGEDCSVTELEYWEATQASDPPRKCFVYLAGDKKKDGTKAYQFDSRLEEKDLAEWNHMDVEAEGFEKRQDDARKLAAFKSVLRSKTLALFKDKQDFKQQLKDSLRKAIQKEVQGHGGLTPPQLKALRQALLIVLLGLQDPLKKCTEGVKLLAKLKRIHDALHRIRQYGIRRWREEVTSSWSDGAPSVDVLFTYVRGCRNVDGLQGLITGYLENLPDDLSDLRNTVKRVTEMKFEDGDQKALTNRERFISDTNRFASRVQLAFTDTNKAMEQRARDLAQYHEHFQQERLKADSGIVRVLSVEYQRLVADEADALSERQNKLQQVLRRHADWQHMHDLLEKLDGTKDLHDPALFLDDLDLLIGRADKLGRLVADAETLVKADPSLKAREADIEAVRTQFEALCTQFKALHTSNDTAAVDEAMGRCYEAMRKAFDNLFFEVDLETLKCVNASERRVVEHEHAMKRLQESLRSLDQTFPMPLGMQ